ncbi:MAG: hypothetical protein OER43_18100 [Gammaproteobacteria bacterium]|nr:hypothetical protein [Gammaproteobacteria bacterium]
MKSRRLVSSWYLLGLIVGHLSTPVAAAPADLVFEYKGIRLGATEQQFRAKHPDFGCPTDPEIPDHRICSRRGATYADLEAQSTEAHFLRNRLSFIQVKFWSLDVSDVVDVIAQLEAALTERYGKPHEGSPEWKREDPNMSIRSSNWYGQRSSMHVLTFWHIDKFAYETTFSIVLDGYWDELFRMRAQRIDKDI